MPALCLNFALYLTQAWPKDFYSHRRRFSKETHFYFSPILCASNPQTERIYCRMIKALQKMKKDPGGHAIVSLTEK